MGANVGITAKLLDKISYQQLETKLEEFSDDDTWTAMAATVFSDWQTTKGKVLERNAYMFGNSLMSDILFVFTSEQTRQTFPAHKYILSTASPVFFALFYGEMKEGNEVQIADVSFRGFLEMLRFLYTDETNLDEDCVLEVLYLAKKYIVPSLVENCLEFLETNIDKNKALAVLELGIKYNEIGITEKCWEVVEQKMKYIVETEEFVKISHERLCTLLKRADAMAIEEIVLFQAVDKWATEQCRMKSLGCSGQNKREVLGDGLNLIRFDCIEQKDFVTNVFEKDILTYEEVKDIELSWYKNEETMKSRRQRGCWMGLEKSTIIGNNMVYLKQLLEWLDSTPTKGLQWEMCFNAKRDGFGAGTFHSRCDNKKYTLTIVQAGKYIFGGYADVPWSSPTDGQYSTSSTCWIFSLKNADNIQPFKTLSTENPNHAIYCCSSYGPSFGIGHGYNLPQGYTLGSSQTRRLLGGSYNFTITNYEVFSTV